MMMFDRKKAAQAIMQRRKAGGGEIIAGPAPMKHEIVKHEDGEMDHRHMAAQDVIMALHEKSPEKLMEAMGAFIDLHHAHGAKPEPVE